MNKRSLLLLLVAGLMTVVPGILFAQSGTRFTSYYEPGNVAVSVEAGASFGYSGFSIAAYPSIEFLAAKYRIGDSVPLDFGVEVKGRVGIGVGSYSGLGIGVGGFGTVHMGFRGMSGDIGKILSRIDVFAGLGVAYDFESSYYNTFGLGFASFGGLNYFLSDTMAVVFGESYWNGFADTTIGLRLRFGSVEAAKKSM